MRRFSASLPRVLGASRHGDVEGGPLGHRSAVPIVDGPPVDVPVVEDIDRVVVVDAHAAPRVPVLGDRKDGIRTTVGERVVQVGGVAHGVGERGAVDETFGRRREDDLKGRPSGHHVAALVERSSRFVMLVRVGGKDIESVVAALSEQIRRLPKTMMATLTWDRGMEMAAHKQCTVATDVAVYFCDPKSPWQRATNENTNRLLRQYLPRRTDLSVYDQKDLDLIALKLNTRPRKTLGYDTPAATLAAAVALTG